MKNLRTHMWLFFTVGVFLLISLIITYLVMMELDPYSAHIDLPQIIRIGIINIGLYMACFLIVTFKAIKYVPSKT